MLENSYLDEERQEIKDNLSSLDLNIKSTLFTESFVTRNFINKNPVTVMIFDNYDDLLSNFSYHVYNNHSNL